MYIFHISHPFSDIQLVWHPHSELNPSYAQALPDWPHYQALLTAPAEDAKHILADRFPAGMPMGVSNHHQMGDHSLEPYPSALVFLMFAFPRFGAQKEWDEEMKWGSFGLESAKHGYTNAYKTQLWERAMSPLVASGRRVVGQLAGASQNIELGVHLACSVRVKQEVIQHF